MNLCGFFGVLLCFIMSIFVMRGVALRYHFSKKYIKNHLGKKFVVFHVYKFTGASIDCGLEAHITTDNRDEILVDMRTPRLSIREGGFRKSKIITKERGGKMCVPHLKEDFDRSTSNNVIVFESDHEFSIMVSTHVSSIEEEIHVLYPVEALGTVYYLLGHGNSLFIIIALEKDTKVDVSDCAHAHKDLQHFENYKINACPFHRIKTLGRYEAYFEKDVSSGHVVMATKPVLVMSETTEGIVSQGNKAVDVTGYAATQFMPVEKWDRMFVFPLPQNPKISDMSLHITVEYIDSDLTTLYKPITSIYWRHDSRFSQRMTEIIKPKNFMDYKLFFARAHNVKLLKVCVSVRASAVLLFHTQNNEKSALGISNLPPISHFDNIYMWNHNSKQGWKYFFHIICPNDEMTSLQLTRNKHPVPLQVEQKVMYYEYAMVNLTGTGMYQLVSKSTLFMVFLEAYHPNGYSTLMSELGSRYTDVESDCTCHFEMQSRNDPPNHCDDEVFAEDTLDDDEDEGLSPYHLDYKGEHRTEEWGRWMCDNARGFMYRNRTCRDALLESVGLQCNPDREEYPDKHCNFTNEPCPGYMWGPRCNTKCPPMCDGDKSCNHIWGTCDHGCKSGYHGPFCNTTCHVGYAGKDCKTRCSNICPSKLCDPVSLACTEGAVSKVIIGLLVTSFIIFVVCPGIGVGLYVLTLMRLPPDIEWEWPRFWSEDEVQELQQEDDRISDEKDDDSSSTSSPPSSKGQSIKSGSHSLGEERGRRISGIKEDDEDRTLRGGSVVSSIKREIETEI